MGTHAGSISHRVEEGGQKLSLGTQIATRSSVPCNFRCPRCGVLVHHNLRIIHSTVGDIEHVVDIMAKVFGMEVLGDDRAPPHIHQTSCKLSSTLALSKFKKRGGGEKVIHTNHKSSKLCHKDRNKSSKLCHKDRNKSSKLCHKDRNKSSKLCHKDRKKSSKLCHKDRNSRIHNL